MVEKSTTVLFIPDRVPTSSPGPACTSRPVSIEGERGTELCSRIQVTAGQLLGTTRKREDEQAKIRETGVAHVSWRTNTRDLSIIHIHERVDRCYVQ